jgi:DNA-directed RNA polymerase subunit RPC12/RpoP
MTIFQGCYESFPTEGWLQGHRATHHRPPPKAASPPLLTPAAEAASCVYPCSQCGKEFLKLSKLTQHLKTHSPDSHYKYPCDLCGKKFTRPQHVIRHKLLHTGERPYVCQTCGRAFAREDKLKAHVKAGCSPVGGSGGCLDLSFEGHAAMAALAAMGMVRRREEEEEEGESEKEIDDDEGAVDVKTTNLQVGVIG